MAEKGDKFSKDDINIKKLNNDLLQAAKDNQDLLRKAQLRHKTMKLVSANLK